MSDDHHLPGDELDALWDFTDLQASLTRLVRARDAADGIVRDELTTQVARARGLLGDVEEAYEELDALASKDPVVRQRVALERGRLFAMAGPASMAGPCFEIAREIAADESLTVDALHMLAILDPVNAEEHTRAGLQMAQASDDPRTRRWEGALLNNLAWNHADAGRRDAAIATFEQVAQARQVLAEYRATPPSPPAAAGR